MLIAVLLLRLRLLLLLFLKFPKTRAFCFISYYFVPWRWLIFVWSFPAAIAAVAVVAAVAATAATAAVAAIATAWFPPKKRRHLSNSLMPIPTTTSNKYRRGRTLHSPFYS